MQTLSQFNVPSHFPNLTKLAITCYWFLTNLSLFHWKLNANEAIRKLGVCPFIVVTFWLAREVLVSSSDWSRVTVTCSTVANLNKVKGGNQLFTTNIKQLQFDLQLFVK